MKTDKNPSSMIERNFSDAEWIAKVFKLNAERNKPQEQSLPKNFSILSKTENLLDWKN